MRALPLPLTLALVVASQLLVGPAAATEAMEAPDATTLVPEVAWHASCHLEGPPYGLRCGDAQEPCAAVQDPACWGWRFFCWAAKNPLEGTLNGTVHCEQQPGCCIVALAANCQNYGIQVIVTTSNVCSGEDCSNFGVRVIIGNAYCDLGPVSVCVASKCVAPVECPPYAAVKWCWARPTDGPTSSSEAPASGAA